MVLLPFHAPVLEPDFDLSFCETQRVRDLNSPPASQVSVEVELFLELEDLMACVSRPRALVIAVERTVAP